MKVNEMSMWGGGYYNENSNLQQMGVDKSFDVFIPPSFEGKNITIADYGCSEGRNSVKLIKQYLSRVPGISSATLIFNDTPFNDFSSLSSTIESNRSALSQDGKVNIYPLLSPQSFYEQVVPDESVDAGFCFTALHWLRNVPTSTDLSVLSTLAHTDLVTFLSARHREIRQGGQLMLCIPIDGPTNVYFPQKCLEDAVRALASTYPVDPSVITHLPAHWRTMNEITDSIAASQGDWQVLQSAEISMEHPAASLVKGDHAYDPEQAKAARDKYVEMVAGFVLAPFGGFVLDDLKAKRQKENANGADIAVEVARLRQELTVEYRKQISQTYAQEAIGLTYAYVQLKRL